AIQLVAADLSHETGAVHRLVERNQYSKPPRRRAGGQFDGLSQVREGIAAQRMGGALRPGYNDRNCARVNDTVQVVRRIFKRIGAVSDHDTVYLTSGGERLAPGRQSVPTDRPERIT